MTTKKHIGSSFDDFLKEKGLLENAQSIAEKRVSDFQLEQELKKQKEAEFLPKSSRKK